MPNRLKLNSSSSSMLAGVAKEAFELLAEPTGWMELDVESGLSMDSV